MTGKETRPGSRKDHRPRMVRPKQHDSYARKRKARDVQVCERCRLVYRAGRWTRDEPPAGDFATGLCPACARMRDRYPAGTLRLPADFLERREEVLGMIRNAEQAETLEHPLERLMDVEDAPDGGLVVTTTGLHLARAIASKLERRFHREARIRYPAEQHEVHVDWAPRRER